MRTRTIDEWAGFILFLMIDPFFDLDNYMNNLKELNEMQKQLIREKIKKILTTD